MVTSTRYSPDSSAGVRITVSVVEIHLANTVVLPNRTCSVAVGRKFCPRTITDTLPSTRPSPGTSSATSGFSMYAYSGPWLV